MPFVRVKPDDMSQVTAVASIEEAARQVDDPDAFPPIAEMMAAQMRYGWDLDVPEHYLYIPEDASEPVGSLVLDLPTRDNLHLVWVGIVVHPDHRRHGHGSVIMNEAFRLAREAGRNTIWVGTAEDDQGARRFVERFGFDYASHDARRRQVLTEVDQIEIQRLWAMAEAAASDYCLERLQPPIPDEVLSELVEVTAAINDAPMGDLTYEDEKFDLQRLRDRIVKELGHPFAGSLFHDRAEEVDARAAIDGAVAAGLALHRQRHRVAVPVGLVVLVLHHVFIAA